MRAVQALLAVLIFGIAALSGCLANDADGTNDGTPGTGMDLGSGVRPEVPENFMPQGGDHDHTDPSQHQFLWNYELSSYDPMVTTPLTSGGLHALARAGDILVGAAYGANIAGINGGLYIWDISTPDEPVQLGVLPIPGYVGGDRSIDITPDGRYVALGLEQLTCFGHVNPNPFAAMVVDISNPTLPLITDFVTITGATTGAPVSAATVLGTHSVRIKEYNDERQIVYFFGNAYDLSASGTITRVDAADIPVAHDLYIRDTPWGATWALAANGGDDFVILDVTEPDNPVELGRFETDGPYYLHTADVWFAPDGQVIVMLSSEDWLDHVSPMWFFDATELKGYDGSRGPFVLEPALQWGNPFDSTAIGLSYSLHNPRFAADGILTMSSYHGGVFQLDFRHPDFRLDPAMISYAAVGMAGPIAEDPVANAVETALCGLGITIDTPTYMDVELGDDGILYAADVWTGLYTFRPTADHPVYGALHSEHSGSHSGMLEAHLH